MLQRQANFQIFARSDMDIKIPTFRGVSLLSFDRIEMEVKEVANSKPFLTKSFTPDDANFLDVSATWEELTLSGSVYVFGNPKMSLHYSLFGVDTAGKRTNIRYGELFIKS